jgi:hypothetical protein
LANRIYINDYGQEVPDKAIVVVPHNSEVTKFLDQIIEPLAGNMKRDWFNSHFYYCLPINIGNQYGFAIKSMWDFNATWDGSSENSQDIEIEMISEDYDATVQYIGSGFSEGVLTIQNFYHMKTAKGINLMTIQPPNYGIPGTFAMTGVIETDNLRRDFTFNLKLTDPGRKVRVRKGDWLGAFIPIPRYFVDSFEIVNAKDLFSEDIVDNEIFDGDELARQRNDEDKERPHESGRKYFNGEHAFGCPYPDHQKRVPAKLSIQETGLEFPKPSSGLSKAPRLFHH